MDDLLILNPDRAHGGESVQTPSKRLTGVFLYTGRNVPIDLKADSTFGKEQAGDFAASGGQEPGRVNPSEPEPIGGNAVLLKHLGLDVIRTGVLRQLH